MDERCGGCGEFMIVVPNPSESMLVASGGFEQLKTAIIELTGSFDINKLQLGMCPECDSTSIIGPQVMFEGEIIDQEMGT